ncbi:DUF6794 domain-containing protein [Glacieibacterium frigidum]|uniref:DUF6794 domain-containing protein n=1 Tax=Glacieibacterium frigidum TaxID=2593303 RepID=A0A552UIG8_9SPHN|nr:DUF6794 domain-containing protein [Glacieibacterium frigidum]TRW18014.1 hypothetical protein FMM06_07835 [Glacieibacterium frigidum]
MRRVALLLVAAATLATGAAADPVGDKLIACAPATFEAAVKCLDDGLPAATRAQLVQPGGTALAHHGLGTFLRNQWGLWKNGPLAVSMREMGFRSPDDMSGAILSAYAARHGGAPYDVRAAAAASTNNGREAADRERQSK